jgi:hypothetical protein
MFYGVNINNIWMVSADSIIIGVRSVTLVFLRVGESHEKGTWNLKKFVCKKIAF